MLPQLHYQMSKDTNNKSNKYLGLSNLGINLKKKAEKLSFFSRFRLAVRAKQVVLLWAEVTKIVYFIGNEHMLIAHDSNRLRFS